MSNADHRKDELLRVLNAAEDTHSRAQHGARELARSMQPSRDLARITRAMVENIAIEPRTLEKLTYAWRRENDAARIVASELRELSGIYDITFNATTSAASTAAVAFLTVGGERLAPKAKELTQHFNVLMERKSVIQKVRAALHRCGLDRLRDGRPSPLGLVDDADAAISRPAGPQSPPSAALTILREGIGRAVLDAFGRSGQREEARTWAAKVLALGNRCASVRAPEGHFKRLAEDAASKIDAPPGNDQDMDTDEVLLTYFDGLNFLLTFLDGIDETRLQP